MFAANFKRKPNFTQADKLFMATEYDKYREILTSKNINSETNRRKQEAWQVITAGLNILNPSVVRVYEEVKKKWENMCTDVKKKFADRRYMLLNGASEDHLPQLEPWQEKIISIFSSNLSWLNAAPNGGSGEEKDTFDSSLAGFSDDCYPQAVDGDNDDGSMSESRDIKYVIPQEDHARDRTNDRHVHLASERRNQQYAVDMAASMYYQQFNGTDVLAAEAVNNPGEMRSASVPTLGQPLTGHQMEQEFASPARKRQRLDASFNEQSLFPPSKRVEDAQLRLLAAQTEKTEAETKKIQLEMEILALQKAKLEIEVGKLRGPSVATAETGGTFSTTISQGTLQITVASSVQTPLPTNGEIAKPVE